MAVRVKKVQRSIGELIDQHFALVERKRTAQRGIDELSKEMETLQLAIIEEMKKSGLTAARGKSGMATKSVKVVPQIEDYDALIKHIKKTGDFDLLQRRVSVTAVKERWEQEIPIPGVIRYSEVTLHWTKSQEE
jgi:hypothetical protein